MTRRGKAKALLHLWSKVRFTIIVTDLRGEPFDTPLVCATTFYKRSRVLP